MLEGFLNRKDTVPLNSRPPPPHSLGRVNCIQNGKISTLSTDLNVLVVELQGAFKSEVRCLEEAFRKGIAAGRPSILVELL
jgi:hypothetical protein